MIIKLIRARVRPGCMDQFLAQQRIWNDRMSRQAGFLGVHVGTNPDEPDIVTIAIMMDSRPTLERFMATDHDPVARETSMAQLYSDLDVKVLDIVDPVPPQVRLDIAPSRASSGYQISALSELYRVSCILRTALVSGLFDEIGDGSVPCAALAAKWRVRERHIRRLTEALAAINLVTLDGDTIRLKPLAARHLVKASETYLGHLVLHNTRPALWQRWGKLHEQLGLPDATDQDPDEVQFLHAMSDVASAGQAGALAATVDLSGCRLLLDVGGALGDYAIALCRAYPQLRAVVFDLVHAREAFERKLAASGLGGRVSFVAGDYRAALPSGDFDVTLLSNVLRGEVPDQARALIGRIHDAMPRHGLLVVQDLFVDDTPGRGPLLAALFGMHLPDSMNGSTGEVTALLAAAGFQNIRVRSLDHYVVADKIVVAEKS